MKTKMAVKSAFIAALIIFDLSISFGQVIPKYYWRTIPSQTASHLRGVSGMYVVGENGAILHKTGINTYTLIDGIPNYIFNSVCGYSNNYNTAVGMNGIIYYCSGTNQSTIWTSQNSGTNANLNSVALAGTGNPANTRIAVGNGGTILKSTSSNPINWTSWSSVTSNTTQNLNAIALDTSVAIIAGDNGTILRSSNKGNSWSVINTGFNNKLNSVYVFMFDFRKYWITGDNGLILKSTNAGLNWIQVPSGTTANLKSFTPYIICGSSGTALRSLDSGNTWFATNTFIGSDLNSITGIYGAWNSEVVTVGNAGKILKWDTDSAYFFRKLEGNSISSLIMGSGIFDQNITQSNSPGFEWPKGSGRYALFTTGLSMSAMVQGQLRQSMASYQGEMAPGSCSNGIPFTNDTFRVYSVKRTDNPGTFDWQNWGLMVPYGAPYVDVNNNGLYEPGIDTPGVKNASQTVFVCMTDGFPDRHTSSEGFGGGTQPLYNEVHLTAWCYSQPTYTDMQFLKFEVINKGNAPWTRTYFSIVSDPDLGDAADDYIGCDTSRNLGYCYNSDNMDGNGNPPTYGASPPAAGYIILKGAYRKYVNPGYLSMTAFNTYIPSQFAVECEWEPNIPVEAYYYMQGYKRDSTFWLDPTQSPKKKTKYIYPGDPETNTGWTEYKGSIRNCHNDTTGQILTVNPPGDRRLMLHTGSDEITVMPGDTQRIVMCQLIARGSSNLNSVTKLKELADVVQLFYESNYTIGVNQISSEVPSHYSLEQNYPNPFNPVTKIKFNVARLSDVKIIVYDVTGREVRTIVNERLQAGKYETAFDGVQLSSGVYFYRLTVGDFSETKRMVLIK